MALNHLSTDCLFYQVWVDDAHGITNTFAQKLKMGPCRDRSWSLWKFPEKLWGGRVDWADPSFCPCQELAACGILWYDQGKGRELWAWQSWVCGPVEERLWQEWAASHGCAKASERWSRTKALLIVNDLAIFGDRAQGWVVISLEAVMLPWLVLWTLSSQKWKWHVYNRT